MTPNVHRVVALALVMVFVSGCSTKTGGDSLDPDEAQETRPDDDVGNARGNEDDAEGGQWWKSVQREGFSGPDICVSTLCLIKDLEDDTAHFTQKNATTLRIEGTVEWGDSGPSIQDRIVTVSCEGECQGLEEDQTFSGASPLPFAVDGLGLAPNATLSVAVRVPDPTPDPVMTQIDGTAAFHWTGKLLLQEAS